MGKNADILISIYKKAKAQRIVLNQTEFTSALGYSRVHLFDKMIKSKSDIPQIVIEKAHDLLNNTKNVSRETPPPLEIASLAAKLMTAYERIIELQKEIATKKDEHNKPPKPNNNDLKKIK